jgi:hypothetical protein
MNNYFLKAKIYHAIYLILLRGGVGCSVRGGLPRFAISTPTYHDIDIAPEIDHNKSTPD